MQTSLIAKIKKIDINNKVMADKWIQTINITLSDIELNDENLINLRSFRPNEEIVVDLKKLQMTIEEMETRKRLQDIRPRMGKIHREKKERKKFVYDLNKKEDETEEEEEIDDAEEEESESLFEIEESIPENENIVKTFDFSNL